MRFLIVATLITSALFSATDDRYQFCVRESFLEEKMIEELKLLESINNSLILIQGRLAEIGQVADGYKVEEYSQIMATITPKTPGGGKVDDRMD